jgi:oligopeptide transport system substrate-binding protein
MKFLFVGVATVFVAIFANASPQIFNTLGVELPMDAAPIDRQHLRIVYGGAEPRTLDATLDNYGSGRVEYLFDRLTLLDEDEQLIPGAAESWESTEGGTLWTFFLRHGAEWSDGRPVTAHDFEWTYKTLLKPSIGNVYAFLFYEIANARAYNLGEITDESLIGVRAKDDYTLEVRTDGACPYLPYLTSYLSASPIPSWQYEKYGDRWARADNIVTNGSYRVLEWLPQQRMVFGLNPRYDGPYRGLLERVTIPFIGDGSSGILAYENDEIDILHNINPLDLRHINADPVLRSQLATWPHNQTWYLFFQTEQPPFDDVKVRKAISHVLDREAICQVVRNGLGVPAYTMLPPGFPGYVGDQYSHIQAFNPALGQQLLEEAGYPRGRGFPRVEFWISGKDVALRSLAQAIQGMLKQHLGIQVDLQPQEGTVFMTNLYQHAIPMGISAFQSDYPDPHNLLAMVWHSQPVGHGRHAWRNPTFDALVDGADHEMDQEARMNKYAEAERLLADDVGGAFLFHTVLAQLRKPNIKGFATAKSGHQPFFWNHITHTRLYVGN